MDYALPRLGAVPVDAIAGADVMDVLPPIWFTKRDTARTVRQRIGTVLALEFLVLTTARSGEVRNACWEEFDLEGAVWTIPAERMKAGREHRVPLSPRTLEVFDEGRRRLLGTGCR